tara:strand:- start:254 stop:571 length:318 start_codon:yes stop_codon:yes gene_type:complete
MTKIRQIVKDAFKCDELVYQFERIDVEDGIICKGIAFPTGDDVIAAVNAEFSDAYILGEAANRLDISRCNIEDGGYDPTGEDMKIHKREFRQLSNFINKYSKAAA